MFSLLQFNMAIPNPVSSSFLLLLYLITGHPITTCRDLQEALRKTKIFCTMGPASWSLDGLCALIDNGMNVARFNFSHGDHAGQQACLDRLREAIALRPGCNVAVLLDTKGLFYRTSFLFLFVSLLSICYCLLVVVSLFLCLSRSTTACLSACIL